MNFRLTAKDVRFILFILMILLFTFTKSFSAAISSVQSSAWNSTSTWNGGVVPGLNDDVTIGQSHAITVDINAECKSLSISSGSSTATNLSLNTSFNLTVTGAISFLGVTSSGRTKTIAVNTSTLRCGSISYANNTSGGISRVTISTGSFIVNGNITMSGSTTENYVVFTGAGTLLISGSWTDGAITTVNNCKVVYRGSSAQTVRAVNYRKLQFYGTGVKTLAGNITVGSSAGDSLDIREGTTLNTSTRVISAGTSGIVYQVSGTLSTTNTAGLFGTTSTAISSTNSPSINLGGILQLNMQVQVLKQLQLLHMQI